MRALSLIAGLFLTGCSMLPQKTITIKIPVPIPCITEIPQPPKFYSDTELLAMPEGGFVTALHIDRLNHQGYEAMLEAALAACR